MKTVHMGCGPVTGVVIRGTCLFNRRKDGSHGGRWHSRTRTGFAIVVDVVGNSLFGDINLELDRFGHLIVNHYNFEK